MCSLWDTTTPRNNIIKCYRRKDIYLVRCPYLNLYDYEKQIERTILHIRDLERRLNEADNNFKYIKVVQALKHSLDKLYSLLLKDTALQREYQSTYINYFYGGSLSFYNKVCNSLHDYKYGNRPFWLHF